MMITSAPGGLPRRDVLGLAGAAGLTLAAGACSADSTTPEAPKGLDGVEPIQLGPDSTVVRYPDSYLGPTASRSEPFGDPGKTFTVVVQQDAQVIGDWNDNGFTRWLEERTGVKVRFQSILATGSDGSIDLTKINAMIAAGELPDAFLGIPFSDDQVSVYGQQGLFVGLDDYIRTYAPQLRRAMEQYPDLGPLSRATDGRTYQFRGVNDCYHCRVSPGRAYINRRRLDAIGAKAPTNTDELRQVLAAMKDQDAEGGRSVIPLGAGIDHPVDHFIMNAFLYNPGGDTTGGWLALADGRVEFVATKPEWREGLRYLRGLFDAGLISRDTFTMTDDAMLQAGNQGRFGVIRAYFWGAFVDIDYQEGARWRDYVSLPPLAGPTGVRYAAWDYYAGFRGSSSLVITNACSDPGMLVRWADAQLELETTLRAYAGTRDDNWSWSAAGEQGINGSQATYTIDTWPAPVGQSWNQASVMYRSSDFRLAQFNDPDKPNLAGDMYKITPEYEKCRQPQELQLPPLIFDESVAAQRSDTAVAVANHLRASLARFATAELEIDDDRAWDDYVGTFDRLGMAQYLELYQQAYERRPK